MAAAGLDLLAGDASLLEESAAGAAVPATTLNAEMGAPVVDGTVEAEVQDCPILDVLPEPRLQDYPTLDVLLEPKSQDYPTLDVLLEPKSQDYPILDVLPEPRLNVDHATSEAARIHTPDEAAHRCNMLSLPSPYLVAVRLMSKSIWFHLKLCILLSKMSDLLFFRAEPNFAHGLQL